MLFLGHLGGYIVNLSDFYSYSLMFHVRRTAFGFQLKIRVGLALAKAAALRVNLNIDGAPITSRTHTHLDGITGERYT